MYCRVSGAIDGFNIFEFPESLSWEYVNNVELGWPVISTSTHNEW